MFLPGAAVNKKKSTTIANIPGEEISRLELCVVRCALESYNIDMLCNLKICKPFFDAGTGNAMAVIIIVFCEDYSIGFTHAREIAFHKKCISRSNAYLFLDNSICRPGGCINRNGRCIRGGNGRGNPV